jgi:hypothetical protein
VLDTAFDILAKAQSKIVQREKYEKNEKLVDIFKKHLPDLINLIPKSSLTIEKAELFNTIINDLLVGLDYQPEKKQYFLK